jgi:hypothetical protein
VIHGGAVGGGATTGTIVGGLVGTLLVFTLSDYLMMDPACAPGN